MLKELTKDAIPMITKEEILEPVMRCCKCGSEDVKSKTEDHVDVGVGPGIPCEESYSCKNCGEPVNYWAYGNWEYCWGQVPLWVLF